LNYFSIASLLATRLSGSRYCGGRRGRLPACGKGVKIGPI
jgi:hypothetical protein